MIHSEQPFLSGNKETYFNTANFRFFNVNLILPLKTMTINERKSHQPFS